MKVYALKKSTVHPYLTFYFNSTAFPLKFFVWKQTSMIIKVSDLFFLQSLQRPWDVLSVERLKQFVGPLFYTRTLRCFLLSNLYGYYLILSKSFQEWDLGNHFVINWKTSYSCFNCWILSLNVEGCDKTACV